MSKTEWRGVRRFVYERANGCCEYCQTSEQNTGQAMQIDHIFPDGGDEVDNLCLACWSCNNYKRQVITANDPVTETQVALYNPRTQKWKEHFVWIENSTVIQGLTVNGRATIVRLKMNRPSLLVARQRWVEGGYHPPS